MTEVITQTIPAEHVLGAALMFVHPANGRRYYGTCEKIGGTNQDFVVYRREAYPATEFKEVARLDGAGLDAKAFITMGGVGILPNGYLEMWASGQPKDIVDNSGTGFDAIGKIVPNVDEPYALPKAVTAVPVPSHIRLNPPDGFKAYGANQSFAISAEVVDGLPVYYLAQEGWGYSPFNKGFGEYVFRQVGDRKATYVRYNGEDVMDGRGDLYAPGNGKLYITGNESDDDKLPSVYEVPGYVPFGSTVYIGGGSTGGVTDTALAGRVAVLEQQLADALKLAKQALDRANYVKSIYEPVWVSLEALENRPVGISRDEGWQLAKDAVYADLGDPKSGNYARVLDIARQVVGTAGGGIDQAARDIANEALKRAGEAKTLAGQATAGVADAVKAGIDNWLAASVAYTDKRLLNLLWDRAVKLLRYKERTGKTAEELPINDPANLKV